MFGLSLRTQQGCVIINAGMMICSLHKGLVPFDLWLSKTVNFRTSFRFRTFFLIIYFNAVDQALYLCNTMRFYLLLSQILPACAIALAPLYPRNESVASTDKSLDKSNKFGEIGSVICVSPGQLATATWVNALHQTCTWTGVVGSNFGPRGNGNEYFLIPCVVSDHYITSTNHDSYN